MPSIYRKRNWQNSSHYNAYSRHDAGCCSSFMFFLEDEEETSRKSITNWYAIPLFTARTKLKWRHFPLLYVNKKFPALTSFSYENRNCNDVHHNLVLVL